MPAIVREMTGTSRLVIKAQEEGSDQLLDVFQANWNAKGELIVLTVVNPDGTLTRIRHPKKFDLVIQRITPE